jgi:excisionase family DNA binding protein
MTASSHPQKTTEEDNRPGKFLSRSTPRYLTTVELSEVTGISVSTIQRLRRKGVLPFYQPGGPRTRIVFPPDAIEQATEANHKVTGLPPNDTVAASSENPQRGPRPKWQGGST